MCCANKLAESIVKKNKTRDFWTEVKKIRQSGISKPSMVDGETDPYKVADIFADKYKNLYNSVSYDGSEMEELVNHIDTLVSNFISSHINTYHINSVSVDKLVEATSKLKRGKHGGDLGHYADHIINGTPLLNVHLSCLFNSMLIHGTAPEG